MKSFFGKIVLNKLLDNHPHINKAYCINTKQKRHKCSVCQDICKEKSIISPTEEIIDKSTCTDCSLCVANCPTSAIVGSLNYMEKIFEVLNSNNMTIILGCNKSDEYCDCKLHCLSSYPWELISAVALNNKVFFSTGDCENCLDYSDYSYMLEKTKKFLGEKKYKESIIFSAKQLEVTRLEAFNIIFKKSKNLSYSFLRNIYNIENFDQIWRKILIHKQNSLLTNWDTPLFNENCLACGICAKICPTNSLQLFNDEQDKYYIAHFSKKCRGCSLCEKICPYKGINEIIQRENNTSSPFITKLDVTNCTVCNKITKNLDSICDKCKDLNDK